MIVTAKKAWAYIGYEPVIAPVLAGTAAPLWSSQTNLILTEGNIGSGAVPPFRNTLPTVPQITPILGSFNNNAAISQGRFIPTTSNPNAKIILTDNIGCTKEFISNTYYLLSSQPIVTVRTDKQVVCSGGSGGEICFYLRLQTNALAGQKYLPTSFKVPYELRPALLRTDGTWTYNGLSPKI